MKNFPILDLIDFWCAWGRYTNEVISLQPFHIDIAKHLTDIALGRNKKLYYIFCLPPRFGKSVLSMKMFGAWCYSFIPDCRFLYGGYNLDVAQMNTMAIRNIISSDFFKSYFPMGAKIIGRKGSVMGGANDEFHTEQGGICKALGRGGSGQGFEAGSFYPGKFKGCVMIDDPIKQSEADSVAAREECKNWFDGTLRKRVNNYNSVPHVLVMQRLHKEDLAGYIMEQFPDKCEVINIQALTSEGESVWPSKISTKELLDEEKCNPSVFWSQFMQEPQKEGVFLINTDWFVPYNKENMKTIARRITRCIITADTAYKETTSADNSVLQLWGFEGDKKAYLLDQVYGKWSFPDLLSKSKEFYTKYSLNSSNNRELLIPPVREFYIEDRASGTSLAQTLKSKGVPARLWLPDDKKPKDKVSRVHECNRFLAEGRIHIPAKDDNLWVSSFLKECQDFVANDKHRKDDMVDAYTMAILIWSKSGASRL